MTGMEGETSVVLPLLPTVLTGVKQEDQFGGIAVKRDILGSGRIFQV